MIVELEKNAERQTIGWSMKGDTPDEILKLNAIRNLNFFGDKISYNGRRDSDDQNNNAGTLSWTTVQSQIRKKMQDKIKDNKVYYQLSKNSILIRFDKDSCIIADTIEGECGKSYSETIQEWMNDVTERNDVIYKCIEI